MRLRSYSDNPYHLKLLKSKPDTPLTCNTFPNVAQRAKPQIQRLNSRSEKWSLLTSLKNVFEQSISTIEMLGARLEEI
jgi:hypothetical protein